MSTKAVFLLGAALLVLMATTVCHVEACKSTGRVVDPAKEEEESDESLNQELDELRETLVNEMESKAERRKKEKEEEEKNEEKERKIFPQKCHYLLKNAKGKHHHLADEINSCLKLKNLFEGDVQLKDYQKEWIEKWTIEDEVDESAVPADDNDEEKSSNGHEVVKRGASNNFARWDLYLDAAGKKEVPYVYAPSLTENKRARKAVNDAAAIFERNTCIRLVPRRPEDHKTYLKLVDDGGCWSYMGRTEESGPQELSLSGGCEYSDTVIHEVMHALGFWHEQSRHDRDQYVTVKLQNAISGTKSNFKKYKKSFFMDTLKSEYDVNSVMHYGGYSFSKNGEPTIIDKSTGRAVPEPTKISKEDIRQINHMYKCNESSAGCSRNDLPEISGNGFLTGEDDGTKNEFAIGDQVEVECIEGHVVDGASISKCENGGFVPPTLTCVEKDESNCVNQYQSCDSWASLGFCNKKHVAFMREYCPLSCGQCKDDEVIVGDCQNDQDDCAVWAAYGYCYSYEEYMTRHCAKSCNFCGRCEDFHGKCAKKKRRGLCEKREETMRYICSKTCGFCSNTTTV